MANLKDDNEPNGAFPEGLAEALREIDKRHVFVPPEVDRWILARARRRFRRSRLVCVWGLGSAMAAGIVAGAILLWQNISVQVPVIGPQRVAAAAEDVDGDGQVNVLDAFALARLLQAKSESAGRFDLNEDGVVDRADLDRVAARAVRLEEKAL